ncbi:hypothetical protein M5D96_008178 [Drosophila gunungcola]|uniref:Uncharacterized protein n=1 Tax=Drosophila gunungcola TaxID=103775 RepID=A0A9Q0BPX3_9MUSC|nr:hypothetical protein M5D96_008178 [Drosophila gunungcola]
MESGNRLSNPIWSTACITSECSLYKGRDRLISAQIPIICLSRRKSKPKNNLNQLKQSKRFSCPRVLVLHKQK